MANWITKPQAGPETINRLKQAGFSELVSGILTTRNIKTPEEAHRFLNPVLHDPFLMYGMEKVVARLDQAKQNGETVLIAGDYDVDGVTGSVMLAEFMSAVGIKGSMTIPNRQEGYGLNTGMIDKAKTQGISLVISNDCGIANHEVATYAKEQGIDLIITDHHEPGETLPDAYAILNPKTSPRYPFKELCGAGVVFKLISAMGPKYGINPDDYLDLVTLATVADVVPLVDENRALVTAGIPALQETKRVGLKTLMKIAATKEITAQSIAFQLAPRLNAAGRLESPMLAVRLLMATDQATSAKMAEHLNVLNHRRQRMVEHIVEMCEKEIEKEDMIARYPFFVFAGNYSHGVVGIAASRLVERYGHPVAIIAFDDSEVGKASARGIPAFNLFEALNNVKEHLVKFGGHAQAAGFSIHRDSVDSFKQAINGYLQSLVKPDDLVPRLYVDAALKPEEVTLTNIRELQKLAPYGAGNPEPVFLLENLTCQRVHDIGAEKKHLKTVLDGVSGIGFFLGGKWNHYEGRKVSVVGHLQENEWRDQVTVQLQLKDYRLHLEVNRDTCRVIYHHLKNGRLNDSPFPTEEVDMAVTIFEELELCKRTGTLVELLPAQKRNLEDSATFRKVVGMEN